MKKLFIVFMLSGCGNICEQSSFNTSLNICVFQSQSGSFNVEQVEWYFEQFINSYQAHDGLLSRQEIRDFFFSNTTTISFVDVDEYERGQMCISCAGQFVKELHGGEFVAGNACHSSTVWGLLGALMNVRS